MRRSDISSSEVSREDRGEALRRICAKLLERDPDIVEVVLFGSSVYAPEFSRDVDLLVFSENPKGLDVYMDAVDEVDPPFNVDIVVVKPGQSLREEFIRGVIGAFEVLYGDGSYVLSYAKKLGDPTFEEARAALRASRDYFELAMRASDELLRDRHIREAFDALFHAARIAAMTYLSTEVARWGLLRRMLPEPYSTKFKEFIDVLHIRYFYNGEYPEEEIEEEFEKWYRRVEESINDLERKAAEKKRGAER